MIRKDIQPISELGSRAPEAGRIRLGVKAGKAMKSIDTLRFTSPDERNIREIAALLGGEARPWSDPKANPSNQWEVITTKNTVRVMLVPDGISTWYETWTAGGCVRRCDGVECEVPEKVAGDYQLVTVGCLCRSEGARSCDPYTRLQVIIPEIAFRGIWRLQTKGWNAAEELPGMFELIVACAQRGTMVDAELSVERKERMTPLGKRNYVVPRLSTRTTIDQLSAGVSTLQIGPASGAVALQALNVGPAAPDDIADAELIDDELLEIEGLLREDAQNFGLAPDAYIAAIKNLTDDRARWRDASRKVRAGEIEPLLIADGKVKWSIIVKPERG